MQHYRVIEYHGILKKRVDHKLVNVKEGGYFWVIQHSGEIFVGKGELEGVPGVPGLVCPGGALGAPHHTTHHASRSVHAHQLLFLMYKEETEIDRETEIVRDTEIVRETEIDRETAIDKETKIVGETEIDRDRQR